MGIRIFIGFRQEQTTRHRSSHCRKLSFDGLVIPNGEDVMKKHVISEVFGGKSTGSEEIHASDPTYANRHITKLCGGWLGEKIIFAP